LSIFQSLEAAMDFEKQLITLMKDTGHPDLENLYIYTART